MKFKTKKLFLFFIAFILAMTLAAIVLYYSIYAKVYNQSNTIQNTEIGSDVNQMSLEDIVEDMYDFPNRFAGTKSNALAVQYIRNYFRETGLTPYYENSYYHSFYSEYLKNSRYYMLNVTGTIENVVGKIRGVDSTRAVVISAHMDSYLGKGVLDNASGTAALLKIARNLTEYIQPDEYPVDLVFVAFNSEENGMIGSEAFYKELSRDYDEFYNINMDCVGAADKPLAVKNLYENSEELYRDFIPILEQYEIPYRDIVYAADIDGDPLGSSDHEIFQENGHAAIILGEAEIFGFTNTKKDKDMSILDFYELNRLTEAVTYFILSTNGHIY